MAVLAWGGTFTTTASLQAGTVVSATVTTLTAFLGWAAAFRDLLGVGDLDEVAAATLTAVTLVVLAAPTRP